MTVALLHSYSNRVLEGGLLSRVLDVRSAHVGIYVSDKEGINQDRLPSRKIMSGLPFEKLLHT